MLANTTAARRKGVSRMTVEDGRLERVKKGVTRKAILLQGEDNDHLVT
jgi:hypothetical protein